ncbi:hypothetical protein [Gluconobacter oxydans]
MRDQKMARSTDMDEVPTPIGRAPAFLEMLDQVSRLAPLKRPVLVIGERGRAGGCASGSAVGPLGPAAGEAQLRGSP